MPPRPRTLPIVLAGFTAFLDLYATQPLLPLLMDVFGASHFDVSLTVTVATVAVALAAPVVGRVGDLIGRRRVIVLSAFVLAGATAAAATAAQPAAIAVLAVRPGPGDAWRLRDDDCLHPRRVAGNLRRAHDGSVHQWHGDWRVQRPRARRHRRLAVDLADRVHRPRARQPRGGDRACRLPPARTAPRRRRCAQPSANRSRGSCATVS